MDTQTLAAPGPDATPEDVKAYQDAMALANMRAAGDATEERVYDDYFGTDQTFKTFLPDGVSYIETKLLAEGERKKYLNETNRDVTLEKVTGNAKFRMQPGTERAALLSQAIVGWNLRRAGQPVVFGKRELETFLDKANPKTIDLIEKDIRKQNPWLLADLSVEDIDREIADLTELRAKKVEEEEGKGGSSSK